MNRRTLSLVLSFSAAVALWAAALAQAPDQPAPAAAPQTPAGQNPTTPAPATRGAAGQAAGRGRSRGTETPAPTIDTAAIDRALGKPGTLMGDVYKVSFPRSDLSVSVGDVKIKPGFALGGWAAFKLAPTGNQAVAHGDLVLTESELNPVISALQQHDFDITAIHNHLLNASPMVMYVHFWAQGKEASLAGSLKDVLAASKTPLAAPAAPPSTAADDLPVDKIQEAIGMKGTVANGVLSFSQPRAETIQMMGVVLPPSMGMATAINFQAAGAGQVATTGDFVMIADEVNRVARVLRQRNIEITALHNHMMHGSPELYFMHFWAVGGAERIAMGLRMALAQVKRPPAPAAAAASPPAL